MTEDLPAIPVPPAPDRRVMSPGEVATCRAQGTPIGFDPVLQGWVRLDVRTWRAARPERPVLTISFRSWDDADLPVFRDLLSDPDVWHFLPEPFPGDLSEQVARDLLAVAQVKTFHEVRAAIWQGVPIGQVRLQWDAPETPDAVPASAEFSYWLGRANWGRGFGRRIAVKSVPIAFARHSGLQSLWARVHPENRASRRILGDAGFSATGKTTPDGWSILSCKRPAGAVKDWISQALDRQA